MTKKNNRKPPKNPSVLPPMKQQPINTFLRKHPLDPKISNALLHKLTIHHGPFMNTRKPHIPHR